MNPTPFEMALTDSTILSGRKCPIRPRFHPGNLVKRDEFQTILGAASLLHGCIACCGNYLSGMRALSQSPMREAEGLSRLHNTITDWPDSGYTRRVAFIPGAPPP